ncbi:MAG TPA: peptidoglycan-binding domain-containing protein [Pseudonocardia sp.]
MTLLVALGVSGLCGLAAAEPGVGRIGPGPSDNRDGVLCVQRALNVSRDGQFGQQTYEAVKAFQKAHGLSVDGAVGPLTGDKLLPLAPAGCSKNLPSTRTVPGSGTGSATGSSGNGSTAPGSGSTAVPQTGKSFGPRTVGTRGSSATCSVTTSAQAIHDDSATVRCTITDTSSDKHSVFVSWWQDGYKPKRLTNSVGGDRNVTTSDSRHNPDGSFSKITWRVCTDVQLGKDSCSDDVTYTVG